MSATEDILREIDRMKRRIEALERVEKVFIPAWDDFIVQVGASRLPASAAPAVVSYLGTEVLSFSKTATNTMPFNVQIPHSYQAGTAIELHCHVVYPNAGTGNSIWQATYNWANIDGLFDASSTTGALATAASPNAARSHKLIELVASIDGTEKTLSSILLCSLSRIGGNGGDTYDDVIYLIGVDFHIRKDALGSRQEIVK